MKKTMKKIRLMAILTGMAMMASNNAYSVSATIGYNTPSAVISELDGYTASTQLTEDGTIISTVTVNQRPDCKDVNLITKEEKAYRHREYNGKDFLISVTPTDEAAFVEAFGQSYCTAKQSDGTYILCGKESENLISEMGIYTSVAMLSDWERADAEKAFAQVCDSATVDSAKILQRYTEYTYDQGAFLLHLFSAKPITEERFDFLEDGYSVTIDADKNYPSVALMKDAVYVTDYTQQYQFYRSVLEQMSDVYAIYPYYWYLQTDSGSIGMDTIQEYQHESASVPSVYDVRRSLAVYHPVVRDIDPSKIEAGEDIVGTHTSYQGGYLAFEWIGEDTPIGAKIGDYTLLDTADDLNPRIPYAVNPISEIESCLKNMADIYSNCKYVKPDTFETESLYMVTGTDDLEFLAALMADSRIRLCGTLHYSTTSPLYYDSDTGEIYGLEVMRDLDFSMVLFPLQSGCWMSGDIDFNGEVNADDANVVLNAYLDSMLCDIVIPPTTFSMEDITGNGKVDADDADVILCYYLYIMTGGKQMTVTEFFESGLYYSEHG